MSEGYKMVNLLSRTDVQAGLSVLGLLVVSLFALFLLSRLRDLSSNNQDSSAELLKNFEEMRREGDIDEKEFRNIQTLLKNDMESPPS